MTLTGKAVLAVLALTVLIAALVIWQTEQDMNQLLLDLTRAQARVFLIGVEREIQWQAPDLEPRKLQEIVTHAVTHDVRELDFLVESLLVVNWEGKVIAASAEYHVGEDLRDHAYLLRAIQENEFVSPGGLILDVSSRAKSPVPSIDVVAPLHLKDGTLPVGAIEVELDVSKSVEVLQNRYWDIRRTLLIKVVLLMGSLAVLGLLALRYQVIARLGEMDRVATSISQGNLEARVRNMGSDEIGSLAGAFNQMTGSLEQTIGDLKRTEFLAMTKLAELAEQRDADTGAHLLRIPRYCQILVEELRRDERHATLLDDSYAQALLAASPLHDIGKVATPDAILLKPGRLTPEEFAIIKQHTLVGADILSGANFLKMAHDIALAHHEKHDGSGYPSFHPKTPAGGLGTRGESIHREVESDIQVL
jgi:HAMP domain-containing protein